MSSSKNLSLEKDSTFGILRFEYGDLGSCYSVNDDDLRRLVSTSICSSNSNCTYFSNIEFLGYSFDSSTTVSLPFSVVMYLMTSTSFSTMTYLMTTTGF
jgi:hypothetical protein